MFTFRCLLNASIRGHQPEVGLCELRTVLVLVEVAGYRFVRLPVASHGPSRTTKKPYRYASFHRPSRCIGTPYFETLHDARRAARETIIFDVCAVGSTPATTSDLNIMAKLNPVRSRAHRDGGNLATSCRISSSTLS